MPNESFPDTITAVITLRRDESVRRGRLGATARNAKYDAGELARRLVCTRLAKLTPDERHAYFADLGRRSQAARRAVAGTENGGAA